MYSYIHLIIHKYPIPVIRSMCKKTFFVWKLFPTFGVLEKVLGSLQKFTTKTKNCLPLLFTISTKDKHSQPLKWFLLMPCWAFTLAKIFCESWYESNNKDNMFTVFYYWERETYIPICNSKWWLWNSLTIQHHVQNDTAIEDNECPEELSFGSFTWHSKCFRFSNTSTLVLL